MTPHANESGTPGLRSSEHARGIDAARKLDTATPW
jgi:hypothetical protein